MAETEQTPSYSYFPCILDYECENSTINCTTTHCHATFYPILPPPPPPPPPPQTHFAPFLIAIVCVLGISFLLLTTCTIILRVRFTSRRRDGVSPINGGGDDDGFVDDGFVDHPIWHITTVGLQQSVIDSITAFKYKKIDGFLVEGDDCCCSVCLTEFEDGDDIRLLPKCSHAFHVYCIDTWLRCHKNCPLCRAPIVNENLVGNNSVVDGVVSSGSGFGDEGLRVNLDHVDVDDDDDDDDDDGSSNRGEGSSDRLGERGDDVLGKLPVLEGIKIAEVLNKNRELRVFSDLGENHRFRGVGDDEVESVRRTFSFSSVGASAKCGARMGSEGCSSEEGFNEEGCSSEENVGDVSQEKKSNEAKEGKKRRLIMSGILVKSSSIGRSLQKGPVSMKRSLSSSSKHFSFRRSKSQASILPL